MSHSEEASLYLTPIMEVHILREVMTSTHVVTLTELLEQVAREFKRTLSLQALTSFNGRLERGLELAKNGAVIPLGDKDHPRRYQVRSSDGTRFYEVDLDSHSCDCPDNQKGHVCKHRIAAYYVEQTGILKQEIEQAGPVPVVKAPIIRPTCSVRPEPVTEFRPTCTLPPKRADFQVGEKKQNPPAISPDKPARSESQILSELGYEPDEPRTIKPSPQVETLTRRYLRGSDIGDQSLQVTVLDILKETVIPYPAAQPVEKWCLVVKGLPENLPDRILFGKRCEEDLMAIFGQVNAEELKGQSIVIYTKPTNVGGTTRLSIRFRRAQ